MTRPVQAIVAAVVTWLACAAATAGADQDLLCQLVDATGQTIPGASVTLSIEREGENAKPLRQIASDANGHFPIPAAPGVPFLRGRVSHVDYGIAAARLEKFADGVMRLQVPLAKQGSDAAARALSGTVTGPDGKPVVGARVRCNEARTPGEGLIAYSGDGEVFTGEDGSFRLYIWDKQRQHERGALIPPGTKFNTSIEAILNPSLFPAAALYSNSAPAAVKLQRPTRQFTIRYEQSAGKLMDDAEARERVTLSYRKGQGRGGLALPARYRTGGALADGVYEARYLQPGRDFNWIEYPPLTVGPESPKDLVFKLPPDVMLTGRVVHGVTGAPVKGATLISVRAVGQNNLALLDAAAWSAIHNPAPGKPTLAELLKPMYEFFGWRTTDGGGRYNLVRSASADVKTLLVFEENFLPYERRMVDEAKVAEQDVAKLPDTPLFAAAKVIVHPVFDTAAGGNISVSPQWIFEKEGQPKWFDKFTKARDARDGDFANVHWLKLNEPQPVFVPAGVKLRFRVGTPYDEQWVADPASEVLELKPGEVRDLGQVGFKPALRIDVRVVDSEGKPVEGLAVRKQRADGAEKVWSVAHNTNADGVAHFYAPPKSKLTFRVYVPGVKDDDDAKGGNLSVEVEVGEKAPAAMPQIKLTQEQAEKLVGTKAK